MSKANQTAPRDPALSFVAKRDKKGRKLVPYDFWSVGETGEYWNDCDKGVRLAEDRCATGAVPRGDRGRALALATAYSG